MSSSIFVVHGAAPRTEKPRPNIPLLFVPTCSLRQAVALTLVSVLLLPRLARAAIDPIVTTEKGKVRGIEQTDMNGKKVHTFYGIPFAEPPLGELRFMQPNQKEPWTGVWDATRLPNSCYQTYDRTFGNFSGSSMWNANTKLSEDCLYLNVWTPRTNPPYRDKAVIVWIYGGGFYSGSSTLDVYMAQIMAAENDVVVVSMQYRLGSLGFLALENSGAMGNAGMWDQRMALDWVKNNIVYFGGSPYNVTLMGESAGAVSVGLLLMCEICQSYYHRAILQSGAPQAEWGAVSKKEIQERSRTLAVNMGCTQDDRPDRILSCLQSKNASEFPIKDSFIVQGIVQFAFVPSVDRVLLHKTPREYLRGGDFKKVPLLLGSNSNEGTFFIIYMDALFKRETDSPLKINQFTEIMKQQMFNYFPKFPHLLNEFGKEAIMFQYRNWLRPNDEIELRKSVDKAVSDYYFVCKVNELARTYANHSVPVYYYWFDQRWSANPWPEWMGVLHADEIWFTFGHPFNRSHSFTEEERLLSRRMMTYWTNFAKTGDPNQAPGEAPLLEWPKFEEDTQRYLNLSVAALTSGQNWGAYPRTQQCAFWEEYLPKLVAETSDISDAEREWKMEFHTWKNRYIVDWKTQFDNFLKNYQERLGTCGGGRP